uniref:Proteoglycan 3 n=1 Tax=Sus scrofa TaxID=9823 RepID=A0A8D1M6G0_PIG
MKGLLLLPLLLLGTVSALHLETQADLRQDLEGSGDQERELALNDEVPESEGEARAPSSQDAFVDEEAMESDQAALDENVECPREEDRVQMQGSNGCQSCYYVLVRRPRSFNHAQYVCRRCYRGNLISIHNYRTNHHMQRFSTFFNQAQVWIGGYITSWEMGSCYKSGFFPPGASLPPPGLVVKCLPAHPWSQEINSISSLVSY